MKVLLIHPRTNNIVASILPRYVVEEIGNYPPLGLMYIASALIKKTAAEVEILDAQLYGMSPQQLKDAIREKQPDLIGITTTTFTIIDAIETAKIAKEVDKNIHICIGGPHTSIYPLETAKIPEVDSVVIGEGEETFAELVQRIENNQYLEGVKGVYFKRGGDIIQNERREFIADIDSLAFPARQLIEYKKYRSLIGSKHLLTTIISSRGCPFNCLYCYQAFGKKYRKRSVNNIIAEIRECLQLGIKEFWFFDDNFTVDRQRTLDFCRTLISEKIEILWHIRTRVDLLDEELLKALKSAGCKRISIGIESGVEKTLKTLRKNIDLIEAKKILTHAKNNGFEIYLDFMIGAPGETKEDVFKTISFATELDPDYVQFAVTTPYPETDLYRMGLEKKVFEKDYWREFASKPYKEFKPMLYNENLTAEQLADLLDIAYRKFYLRPKYILRRLTDIKSFLDLLYKAKAAFKLFIKSGFCKETR